MSTSSPQSCSAKGKISKTILQAKLLHWDQNGEANRSGPASNMHTSSKLRNTHTFGRWETQEISWHLIQALSAHAPIMSLVPAQTIASTRLVLTPLNTSANILFPEQKYNHISHLVVLKGLNHTQQTTQAWVHNGRNYWGGKSERKTIHGLATGISTHAISTDTGEIGLLWEICTDSVQRESWLSLTKLFNMS